MKSKLWIGMAGVAFVVIAAFLIFYKMNSPVPEKGEKDEAFEGSKEPAASGATKQGYPLTLAFRSTEALAGKMSYDTWRATFSPLQGIVGKVLGEEHFNGSTQRLSYFSQYAKEFPEKTVLLHYNGTARDPRYEHNDYFPGHWLHYEGTYLTEALDARSTTVHVENPGQFLMNTGRNKNANDDLTVCSLLPDGKPDWIHAEHLRLTGIDNKSKTLQVVRGAYGTAARSFEAGAYIAPLVGHGPFGNTNNIMMWMYNYSSGAPRDADGKSAGDILAAEMGGLFQPGGALASFDGVEFDVLYTERFVAHNSSGLSVDTDGDGKGDDGIIGGVNVYRQGVDDFLRKLRQTMGDNKLILADGDSEYTQRSFGNVNGIEMEGMPNTHDLKIREWSTGLNNLLYWNRSSYPPNFSYINHKFVVNGSETLASVPFSTTRLVMASAVFTDSNFAYGLVPPGQVFGVWDELWAGAKKQPGWLGQPTGSAVHLASQAPELLNAFSDREAGNIAGDVKIRKEADGIRLEAADGADAIHFRWEGLKVSGNDLFLMLRMKGEPMSKYSDNMARMVRVGWERPSDLMAGRLLVGTVKRSGERNEVEYNGRMWKPDNGATLSRESGLEVDGTAHSAIRFSTPYLEGTGYTYWKKTVKVDPSAAELHFYSTVVPRPCKSKPDGVTFRVSIIEPGHPDAVVFAEHQTAERWVERTADLQPWAGKRVELRFEGDSGPADNSTCDLGAWGSMQLTGGGQSGLSEADPDTPSTLRTWVGREPFDSTFYYPGIGSSPFDLTFDIESTEPVLLSALSARSAPDIVYRGFEHGAVVANPSLAPQKIDMKKLFPGQTFQRIQGTPGQDTATNNGQPVGEWLELGPKDAIFLRRDE
jgi:hypothetical protein